MEIVIAIFSILAFILIIGLCFYLANKDATSKHGNVTRSSYDESNAKLYGDIGEKIVGQRLESIVNTYGGYLYNDFCFEDEYGFSSQIDHILITLGGVFIIETKNMVGTVYGDKDAERWRCIKYQNGNIYEKMIGNPIIQNQGHINHLRDMFASIPPKMTSMVIFVDTDISYIDSNLVYNLPDAIRYIEEMTINSKRSREYVERINDQIRDIQSKYSIPIERHIENIRNRYRQEL